MLAGIRGIDPRSVVGPYGKPGEEEFDAEGFRVNPAFVEALVGYMNEEASGSPEVVDRGPDHHGAAGSTSSTPATGPRPMGEPPTANLLGAFAVDETGQVVPGSFQYNEKHAVFDREQGPSGVLFDRKFYDWLHGIE